MHHDDCCRRTFSADQIHDAGCRALRQRLHRLRDTRELELADMQAWRQQGRDTLADGAATRIADIDAELACLARDLDALLQAGAVLAQTVQDLADDTREKAPGAWETDAEADALEEEVAAWERAYRRVDGAPTKPEPNE